MEVDKSYQTLAGGKEYIFRVFYQAGISPALQHPVLFVLFEIVVFAQFLQFPFDSDVFNWNKGDTQPIHDIFRAAALKGVFSFQISTVVAILWVAFVLGAFIIAGIITKTRWNPGPDLFFRPFHAVILLTCHVFAFPIGINLSSLWNCDLLPSDMECWGAFHMVEFGLSIVCFALFVGFGALACLVHYPRHPGTHSHTARLHGHFHFVEFFGKIALIVLSTFFRNAGLFLGICQFAILATLTFISVKAAPFYSSLSNKVTTTRVFLAMWATVGSFVAELSDDEKNDTTNGNLLAYCATPVVAAAAWFVFEGRLVQLRNRGKSFIPSIYEVDVRARSLLNDQYVQNGEEEAVKHYTAALEHSSKDSSFLFYLFSRFFEVNCSNPHMSARFLSKSFDADALIDVQFFFYEANRRSQESHRHGDSLDVQMQKRFDKLLDKAQTTEIRCLTSQFEFWCGCMTSVPDLDTLYANAARVFKLKKRGEAIYKEAFEITGQSTEGCRKYASFMLDVMNDGTRGEELQRLTERLDGVYAQSTDISMFGCFEKVLEQQGLSILDGRNAVVTASIKDNHFLHILTANSYAVKLFGYSLSWLAKSELTLLFGPRLDTVLNSVLRGYSKNGESNVIQSTRTLLGESKEGHSIPLLCTFLPMTASNAVALVMKPLEGVGEFLLVASASESGQRHQILSGTSRTSELLRLGSNLSSNVVYLESVVGKKSDIWEDLDDFSELEGLDNDKKLDGLSASKNRKFKRMLLLPLLQEGMCDDQANVGTRKGFTAMGCVNYFHETATGRVWVVKVDLEGSWDEEEYSQRKSSKRVLVMPGDEDEREEEDDFLVSSDEDAVAVASSDDDGIIAAKGGPRRRVAVVSSDGDEAGLEGFEDSESEAPKRPTKLAMLQFERDGDSEDKEMVPKELEALMTGSTTPLYRANSRVKFLLPQSTTTEDEDGDDSRAHVRFVAGSDQITTRKLGVDVPLSEESPMQWPTERTMSPSDSAYGDETPPPANALGKSKKKRRKNKSGAASIASDLSSRNSTLGHIQHLLMRTQEKDVSVVRLDWTVLLLCVLAVCLGIFIVLTATSALDDFDVNVQAISMAGERTAYLVMITDRVRQIAVQREFGEVVVGIEKVELARARLLDVITKLDVVQDALFHEVQSRGDGFLPYRLDRYPTLKLLEYTDAGTPQTIMSNLHESIVMFSSKARLFYELPAAKQTVNSSSYRFVATNFRDLMNVTSGTTDAFEDVTRVLNSDMLQSITVVYYFILALLFVVFWAAFFPVLFNTEKAKDKILRSFLTIKMAELTELSEDCKDKVLSRVGEEHMGEMAMKGSKDRHRDQKIQSGEEIGVKKGYKLFVFSLAKFLVTIAVIVVFFTFVYSEVQTIETQMVTNTAEVNEGATRLRTFALSYLTYREMEMNTPEIMYEYRNQTLQLIDDMLDTHHRLLYGDDSRGMIGALGRWGDRNNLLFGSVCSFLSVDLPSCSSFMHKILMQGLHPSLVQYTQLVRTGVEERLTAPRTSQDVLYGIHSISPVTAASAEIAAALDEFYHSYLEAAMIRATELYREEVSDLHTTKLEVFSIVLVLFVVFVAFLYGGILRRLLAKVNLDITLTRSMYLHLPTMVVRNSAAIHEQVSKIRRDGVKEQI